MAVPRISVLYKLQLSRSASGFGRPWRDISGLQIICNHSVSVHSHYHFVGMNISHVYDLGPRYFCHVRVEVANTSHAVYHSVLVDRSSLTSLHFTIAIEMADDRLPISDLLALLNVLSSPYRPALFRENRGTRKVVLVYTTITAKGDEGCLRVEDRDHSYAALFEGGTLVSFSINVLPMVVKFGVCQVRNNSRT